jgi:hypothetical protein
MTVVDGLEATTSSPKMRGESYALVLAETLVMTWTPRTRLFYF